MREGKAISRGRPADGFVYAFAGLLLVLRNVAGAGLRGMMDIFAMMNDACARGVVAALLLNPSECVNPLCLLIEKIGGA